MKSLLSIAPVLGTAMIVSLAAGACSAPDPIDQTASGQAADGPLMPDWDASRSERLAFSGERFRTPEGFRVEEVAGDELIGSAVNLAFTSEGRPIVALEGRGLVVLDDDDGDDRYDRVTRISEEIETAHGLYVLGPGDLLAHANGPAEGTGLYRVRGWQDDPSESSVELLRLSRGGIQEHGPHTITRGADGALYLLFGNHASPDAEPSVLSPLRSLEEDQLLPVILDPRGHANNIRAPGGTIWRVDLEDDSWELLAGGLRNAFDMAFSPAGGLFVYDADMEWDRGLPWYRPTRVLHAIAAGDYGWRTGAGKVAFDNIDTLPSVADIGRGSPVGMTFYRHDAYPAAFDGALFLGDWARGRIRVLMPRTQGASWQGEAVDFVLGEPLNVTDLAIGPDGFLYFTSGGRQTTGGLFRVVYTGPEGGGMAGVQVGEASPVEAALRQPMPRSAWGRAAIEQRRAESGESWGGALRAAVEDAERSSMERQSALEILQVFGPQPSVQDLRGNLATDDAGLRAASVALLGSHRDPGVYLALAGALEDSDARVRRRAVEGLVRSGALYAAQDEVLDAVLGGLVRRLDDDDRFVRYAAREALVRVDPDLWIPGLQLAGTPTNGSLEALLALVLRPGFPDSELVFEQLILYGDARPSEALLGAYLRVLELALVRGREAAVDVAGLEELALSMMSWFPTGRSEHDRKLERILAYLAPPGATAALAAQLSPDRTQEDEIHTLYALRAIEADWEEDERQLVVAWFDRGRSFAGAASMVGYIEALWQQVLAKLPPAERSLALERRQAALADELERITALVGADELPSEEERSRLRQMSFDELAEYVEYDVMAYERPDPERGERVFRRARCAACHVFGDVGRGGGPDLSTVVSRFRRSEILESIVYPSRIISDQYSALRIELRDGQSHTGMHAAESDEDLTLITATGERLVLDKREIVSREIAQVSLMPEGLLEAMSFDDLMSLMRYLEEGSR